ncbi:type II secretion system F family protein [Tepidanaerobacter acetatoxydans]|uniref:type II secretion system F family protein n=1 Tax=Tepidanaerobacter acetatoxydans TaxID=499229 RepID=UPI00235B6324|nr:type II secretion system F family protein [Tepidanaerobacter acetatoxydans]
MTVSWLLVISVSVFMYCVVRSVLVLLNQKTLVIQKRLTEIGANIARERQNKQWVKKKPKLFNIYISQNLQNDMSLSGIKMRPEEFVLTWIFLAVVPAVLLYTITESVIRSLALILIGAIVPPLYLKMSINKKQIQFEKQLGDALQILANGLRAGFSLTQAIESLAKDMPDPLGSEFQTASRELLLGMDIETVLSKIADRMKSEDMRLLTAAVVIQLQVGGNLAEILDNISQTIRDRLAIKRSVRTLTAQGRISGQIVGIIPIALLLIISIISPDYTSIFFTTAYGHIMIFISLIMESLGFLAIYKIVDIKY